MDAGKPIELVFGKKLIKCGIKELERLAVVASSERKESIDIQNLGPEVWPFNDYRTY